MSNQNLVPRTDKSGSIGIPTKKWGSGSFSTLEVDTFTAATSSLTGSFTGSFNGSGSGVFNGDFKGHFSGSSTGSFLGNFTGDGSGLNNITALDTGSLLGIQRIYNSGSQVDDYTTISGALADAVKGDTIFVGSGIYKESDLIVKKGVQLIGKTATDRDVIIDGTSGSNSFVVKVLDDAQFAHFEIAGPNNSNPIIVLQPNNTLGENPFIRGVSIRGGGHNQQTGLLITGSGFALAENISFITKGDAMGDSILFDGTDGLTLYGRNFRHSAIGSSLFKSTGSLGIVEISGIEVEGTAVDYTYGIHIDSDVSFQLQNFNWSNDVSSSLYMDTNSDGCRVSFLAGNGEGEFNDVLIHPSASGIGTDMDFSGVRFRVEKYNDQTLGVWSNNAKVHGLFIDEGLNENPKVGILGNLSIGTYDFPSVSSFGEGEDSILNMKIFSSGSGGWVDQTTVAQSKTGSLFNVFPNDSGSGAAWYVGNIQRKFSGIKTSMIKPQMDGEISGVWEYSTGSQWVPFNILSTDGDYPYNQYGQKIWPSSSTELNNIRFNNLLVGATSSLSQSIDWTKTTINGVNGYWIRYRLTSSLSQSAQLERVTLHTNRTRIGNEGFIEHFGKAEYRRDLTWHKKLEYTLSNRTPSPSTINISPNISLEYPQNQLTNQSIDGSGGIVKVPDGLNTARDVKITFYFIPSINATAAGRQIELEMDVVEIKTGYTLNGTLPEDHYSKIIPITTTDGLKVKKVEFNIDLPNLEAGEFFALSYYRDATNNNPDDTYTGDIRLVAVDMEGVFWNE